MKKLCPILIFFTTSLYCQISVDDTSFTVQQLVENVLINSPCASTSNYQSFTGINAGVNINGIGYFERNGSDFPFENGIVLSTGIVTKSAGPNTDDFTGDGIGEPWFGDSDLENITQTATTQNASFIEFDFVPLANTMRFNFLFASEEYYLNFPCQFSDVFAFILTDEQGVSRNLAVIPGTDIPVRVTEIHPDITGNGGCPAENEDFFDRFNGPIDAAIGLNGQTIPMTATAAVTPGQRYTIKLVIADFQDGNLDSSVFIEGGSFTIESELGADRSLANGNPVCEGDFFDIETNIPAPATFVWRKDGVVLNGETNSTLRVTETGTYSVAFDSNSGCTGTDEIFVEFVSGASLNTPDVLEACSADGDFFEIFDLTEQNAQISGGDASIIFNYYESQADVDAGNPIVNFNNYRNKTNPQEIIVEGISVFGCASYTNLTLSVNEFPSINLSPDRLSLCDEDGNGSALFDLRSREGQILNGQNNIDLFYYNNRSDAAEGDPAKRIQNPSSYINRLPFDEIVYIRAEAFNNSCSTIFPLELEVIPVPELALTDEYALCVDENGNAILPLNAIDTGLNEASYSFSWYIGTEVNDANLIVDENGASYVYSAGGPYTVRILSNAASCEIVRTVFVRTSSPPVNFRAEVISRPFSGNNEVVATVEGNGVYFFTLDDSEPQESGSFLNVPAGSRIVSVFDEFGCGSLSQEILIVDYPRFFTPNGDGINDFWDTSAFSSLNNLEIHIFDRYGKRLKVLGQRDQGWDGTYNGTTLPSSDYWFNAIFSENNVIKKVSGHFALKR